MRIVTRLVIAIVATSALAGCADDAIVVGAGSAAGYVLSCAKSDGGYGPRDQPYSDLAWTFDAVRALDALGMTVPNENGCASLFRAVETAGDADAAYSRSLLGARLGIRSPRLPRQELGGGWHDADGVPTLSATYRAVAALDAEGERPANPEGAGRFAIERLHRDGHFTDTPRDSSESSSGHLWLTFCGIETLRLLGYDIPWRAAIGTWVRSCQREDGGFAWSPDTHGPTDMWYTWLGVHALRALEMVPDDSAAVVDWINRCQNVDAGFGDRPGEASRLESTRLALETLRALTGSAVAGIHSKALPPPEPIRVPTGPIRSAYPGPLPDGARAAGDTWWPGDPVYPYTGNLGSLLDFARMGEVAVFDSVLARFSLASPMPKARIELPTGDSIGVALSVVIDNGCAPDTCNALAAAWEAVGTAKTWATLERSVIHPLVHHGATVCVRFETMERYRGYLAIAPLLDNAEPGVRIVGATSDGIDLVRRFPWLERAVGRVPIGVSWVAAPSAKLDRARMVWIGDDASDAVSAIVGDMPTLYGSAAAISALRSTDGWRWWTR